MQAQSPQPRQKQFGLQLYSAREILDKVHNTTEQADPAYVKFLADLHKMGYSYIETANYDEKGTFYGRTPQQFKQDLADAGLYFLSAHTNHELSLDELKSGDLSQALQWWEKAIAHHKEAGCQNIYIPYMHLPEKIEYLDVFCHYLNEVGKMCKAQGLGFGYHNHKHEFQKVDGEVMYDYMLTHTDPEYVSFEMDVYWTIYGHACPVEYFQKYPGRFKMLHIKDHHEVGKCGWVGFDAIFRNAELGGFKYGFVEVEYFTMPIMEGLKASIDYLLRSDYIQFAR